MTGKAIVTLTLNPTLDVSTSVPQVLPSHKLRCDRPVREPGGGGINVARVCRRLGASSLAVLPLGGEVGRRIGESLADEQLPSVTVEIEGTTRESFSVWEDTSGQQYRFVMPGPDLSAAEVERCRAAVIDAAADARCLVISGSMPATVDPSIIASLVQALPDVSVIVDSSGPALAAAIGSGAHLVKPSARELSNLVGRPLDNEADIETAAKQLVSESNVEVLVASIGPGGAIAVTRDGQSIRLRAPTVRVRSAVGAGDSMVAGLAVGIHRGLDLVQALALGVAAGTATVLTDGTELCNPEDVDELLAIVEASR